MKINDEKISFPVVGKLSFFKVVETLEEITTREDEYLTQYAQQLLKELNAIPELVQGTEDITLIEKHRPLVDRLMRFIFPPMLSDNEIKGATAPFDFDFFYTSSRLKKIIDDANGHNFSLSIKDINKDAMYQMGCATILQAYYHFPVNMSVPMIFDIPEASGDLRYYRSAFNADLMEVRPTKHAIEITEVDYYELMDNFNDIELWKKKFPPNSWEIVGLGLVNLMDITIDQSINMMTSNLLEGSTDAFEKVLENIRSLVRIKDLKISFIRAENDTLYTVNRYRDDNILMNGINQIEINDVFNKEAQKNLFEDQTAFIITNTKYCDTEGNEFVIKQLEKQELRSYIITPLLYNKELLGFLEIGSKNKRELNSIVFERLTLILPLLSMAASRFKEEDNNRVEAIIQERYTSIHSSVKWRFEQAAREQLEAEEVGEQMNVSDLVFNDVYPLYGQMDIRSSSSLRNEAVKADLSLQLKAVGKVLQIAMEDEALPVYEEMLFRVNTYLEEFKGELIEGSERIILDFLQRDIYPIFDYLSQSNKQLAEEIEAYKDSLNEETNMIYKRRKAFDESVNQTNLLLANLIDEKQREAQKMFPHYFERYKTDGVEYNLYIGQSMSEKKKFNPIYLNNLQLWQLNSLCEMELEFHKLRSKLPIPLEIASLILVHSTSLSIHFRMDEKRFDVEGAYNARYEIIKKRVDKAKIKGSLERITAPGKIAIIYSSREDATLYRRHIKFLEAKNYIVPNSIEDYELKDLQGVSGLKALRITVDYTLAEKEKTEDLSLENSL